MKKRQRTNSMFKILVSALFVTLLTSFSEADPCKPPDTIVNDWCEYDQIITCHFFYTGGPCLGKTYDYPNLKPKSQN
jgi:hypothetical protein